MTHNQLGPNLSVNRPAHWEHHGPPPWAQERERERHEDHGRGHGQGHGQNGEGHDQGHGKGHD